MLTRTPFGSGAQSRVTSFLPFMATRQPFGSDAHSRALTSAACMQPLKRMQLWQADLRARIFLNASAYPCGAGLTFGGRDGRRDSARAGAGRECAHGEGDGRA